MIIKWPTQDIISIPWATGMLCHMSVTVNSSSPQHHTVLGSMPCLLHRTAGLLQDITTTHVLECRAKWLRTACITYTRRRHLLGRAAAHPRFGTGPQVAPVKVGYLGVPLWIPTGDGALLPRQVSRRRIGVAMDECPWGGQAPTVTTVWPRRRCRCTTNTQ